MREDKRRTCGWSPMFGMLRDLRWKISGGSRFLIIPAINRAGLYTVFVSVKEHVLLINHTSGPFLFVAENLMAKLKKYSNLVNIIKLR
jgi:hypothetical protein